MFTAQVTAAGIGYRNYPLWKVASFSLTANPGEILTIEGVSGSGKTSLLRYLIGDPELSAHPGSSVTFKSAELSYSPDELRRLKRVGYVGIDHAFLNWCSVGEAIRRTSLLANLEITRDEIDRHPLLGSLGLTRDLARRSPYELSYGQRRRFSIFGTLLAVPKLLLIDEVFSGLEEELCKRLASTLCDYARSNGAIICVTTHEVRSLERYASQRFRIKMVENQPGEHVSEVIKLH